MQIPQLDKKKLFKFGIATILVVAAVAIVSNLFLTSNSFFSYNNENDRPDRAFTEKCESVKAFRIYKDHNGKWACKLDDGRVYTEE